MLLSYGHHYKNYRAVVSLWAFMVLSTWIHPTILRFVPLHCDVFTVIRPLQHGILSVYVYPLRGNKIMVPLNILVWVICLLLAIIPIFIQCYGFQLSSGLCTVSINCSHVCYVYRILLDIVLYIAGAVLPIMFYSLMFLRSKQLEKRVAFMESETLADESNRRARTTIFLLFVSLTGCSLPKIVSFILLPLQSNHAEVYWTYLGLSVIVLYTFVILDPVAIMKHQDLKKYALKVSSEIAEAIFKPCRQLTRTIVDILIH